MFICVECKDSFLDNKVFLRHITLSHQSLSVHTCGKPLCFRKFTSIGSLRKHIKHKHVQNLQDIKNDKETNTVEALDSKTTFSDIPSTSSLNLATEDDDDNTVDEVLCNESSSESNSSFNDTLPNISDNDNTDKFVKFAAKLHNYADVRRSRTKCIINDANELFKHIIQDMKQDLVHAFDCLQNKNKIISNIEKVFENTCSQFANVNTEWLCLKKFEQIGTYIPPQEYLLGERQDFMIKNGVQVAKFIPVHAQFIPIRRVLKKFFEIPGLLNETLCFMNSLQENRSIISNFTQGSLWRDMTKKFENKIVMPLSLYFDDYENNNPLGSHKGISKCGAVYLSIICLPPRLVSKLNNIFLFILFNTLDRKVFKNSIIFSRVLDELKFLENEGVQLNYEGRMKTIYFKLALVLGDNLGLHSILGFQESFNSGSFCRFCQLHKKDLQTTFCENCLKVIKRCIVQ